MSDTMDIEEATMVDELINKLKYGEDVTRELATGEQRVSGKRTGMNEALLDRIFEAHSKGGLTEAQFWSYATLIPKMKPYELNIKLFIDGDKWCALIGKDIQSGTAGFGNTKLVAINDMLSRHKVVNGWICKDCGATTNNFWPDNHRGDIGRCNTCHFKNLAFVYPAPKIEDMERLTLGIFNTYSKWPHHYIPSDCPYCNKTIDRVCVGSYLDHVCHENSCEECKVYFGFTD